MLPDTDIKFLKERIEELRSALFFSLSDSLLKMPTTIVSTLKVDEVGQIWFMIPRPAQALHQFDKEFPARLDYFQKGKQFYIKINGKASIVDDPEDINSIISLSEDVKELALHKMVLVKVKMLHADYYEKEIKPVSPIQQLRNLYHKWFHDQQPGWRPYRMQPGFQNSSLMNF